MRLTPTNPQGKPFTWSYSALSSFESCAAQYAAQRYYCTTVSEETEATIFGTRVHKALEERIRDGKPLEKDFEQYEKWARVVSRAQGEIFCEHEFAFTRELAAVQWFSPEVWVRGVADVMIVNHETKTVSQLDWKTGKVKDDTTQLAMFACFASLLYPEMETFNCKYVWLKHDHITGCAYSKEELGPLWTNIAGRAFRMMTAWETGVFNCNPSGLCRGYCNVTECLHWKPKRSY